MENKTYPKEILSLQQRKYLVISLRMTTVNNMVTLTK